MFWELFEANVFRLLVSEGFITSDLITKIRTWRHSGFHVYAGPTITQKEHAVRVGLYIIRAPASSSRLALAQDGLLKYLSKGSVANDRCDSLFEPYGQILDPLDWIARVTSHIPDQRAQTIRYYGCYSNASRGKAAKRQSSADQTTRATATDSESPWIQQPKANWAALIKLIYEVDPLLCPKCHSRMRVISVIQDPAVIDKILNHLQYKFEVLPLSKRPPPPASACESDFLDPPVCTEGD